MIEELAETSESRETVGIVFAIDGIGAHYLQCYGNSSLATDGFNRLAALGGLADFCFATSPSVGDFCHAVFRPRSAAWQATLGAVPADTNLLQELNEAGVHTVLLTDCAEIDEDPLSDHFGARVDLFASGNAHGTAADAEEDDPETCLEAQFAEVLGVLELVQRPALLWVQLQGLHGPWDAPYERRLAFADDEDPEPPRFTQPPTATLHAAGWDERLGYQQAYFAQLSVIDACLSALVDLLANQRAAGHDVHLAVTSPRGYPLGEDGRVGESRTLRAENTHVPLLWFPAELPSIQTVKSDSIAPDSIEPRAESTKYQPAVEQQVVGYREPAICQPARVGELIRHWFDLPTTGADSRNLAIAQPDLALSVSGDNRALRTPQWTLLINSTEATNSSIEDDAADGPPDDPAVYLYARPDDRFEVNDVAALCPEVIERLTDYVEALEQAIRRGDAVWPAPPDLDSDTADTKGD